MKLISPLFLSLIFVANLCAQQKTEVNTASNLSSITTENLSLTQEAVDIFKSHYSQTQPKHYAAIEKSYTFAPSILKHKLRASYDQKTGEIIAIHGEIPEIKNYATHQERCIKYLEQIKDAFHLTDPASEILPVETLHDDKDRIHTKLDQVYKGIKVFGGELAVHEDNENIYMIQGKTKQIPTDFDVTPSIDQASVQRLATTKVDKFVPISDRMKKMFHHEQVSSELIIYPFENEMKLAWNVDIFASIIDRQTIIIDAQNGATLDQFSTICKFHDHGNFTEDKEPIASVNEATTLFDGQAVGRASDLFGQARDINVFECDNGYFLVDASRPMFSGVPSCASSDRLLNGVIITLDAGNTSPVNDNFQQEIAASGQLNSWDDPVAISAHFNGGRAYEYFKNNFGRESITGNGTNIVAFVNVSDDDGSRMDNAFFNGEHIFYGNGNQAFSSPLAKALDVAGHELSHGVVQTSANLIYQGEPGALNEHFADVFGVLIEDEDFRIGEDVVNTQAFPTGTLRDMGNPNNGGTRLGDRGYQPANVSEQFFGSEDNGGVHINSGIPNFAFFKFVTDDSFGSDINERAAIGGRIWYKALTQYLRSTSNFSDMRIAITQVAMEDFGATVATAAENAFEAVGITTANASQSAQDFETNPGTEFVVWSDLDLQNVEISEGSGNPFGRISATPHLSRPSITDNGEFVIFVNAQRQIQVVEINWSTNEIVRDFIVAEDPVYRNAVISRDASKIAAVTGNLEAGEFENEIIVFDLVNGGSQTFELFNPTFSETALNTEGVLYADVMEFDLTGENLVYDAFNQLSGSIGEDLSYWDIGILNVWSNANNTYGDGRIFKLFNGLPKNVSIGNPTFANNSPNIIAFDYRETDAMTEEVDFAILGLDRESGQVKTIFEESNSFGYPSYSIQDQNMVFHFDNSGTDILAIIELNEDKITSSSDAFIFVENAEWGKYMGTGERDLSTATEEEILLDAALNIYPNPTTNEIFIDVTDNTIQQGIVQLYDLQGKKVLQRSIKNNAAISISHLVNGTYILQYSNNDVSVSRKVTKL